MLKKTQSKWTDWKEYSNFEFRWLEVVLNYVLKKADVISLLRKHQIEFCLKNWEKKISQREMAMVLLCDVPKKELISNVKNLIKKNPELISFEESQRIYTKLLKKDFKNLLNLYLDISQNSKIKDMLKDKRYQKEFTKEDIIGFIIEEIYKMPKSLIKEKLNLK